MPYTTVCRRNKQPIGGRAFRTSFVAYVLIGGKRELPLSLSLTVKHAFCGQIMERPFAFSCPCCPLPIVLLQHCHPYPIQEIATPYVRVYLRKRAQSAAEIQESAETVDGDVHAASRHTTELPHLRKQAQHSRLFHGRVASGQQRPEVSCRVMELETLVSRLGDQGGSYDPLGGVWEAGRTFGS